MFATWQNTVSGGDGGALAAIAELRDVKQGADEYLFGKVTARSATLPSWVATFEWAFAALQQTVTDEQMERLAGEPKLPYESLFYPLVSEARRRRDKAVDPAALIAFATGALDNLDRALIVPLAEICVRALNDRFSLTLQAQTGGGILATLGQKATEGRIPAFIEWMRGAKLAQFFKD